MTHADALPWVQAANAPSASRALVQLAEIGFAAVRNARLQRVLSEYELERAKRLHGTKEHLAAQCAYQR
jgi:hypothetical protein